MTIVIIEHINAFTIPARVPRDKAYALLEGGCFCRPRDNYTLSYLLLSLSLQRAKCLFSEMSHSHMLYVHVSTRERLLFEIDVRLIQRSLIRTHTTEQLFMYMPSVSGKH